MFTIISLIIDFKRPKLYLVVHTEVLFEVTLFCVLLASTRPEDVSAGEKSR